MERSEVYRVILRAHGKYLLASSIAPDMHETFDTKEDAILAGRAAQRKRSADPSAVLDLTNVHPDELTAYFKWAQS